MGEQSRPQLDVRRLGQTTVVRRVDGQGLAAYVIPNPRDIGCWIVFKGPDPESMSEPLSGGYTAYDEAVSAAQTWVSHGIRRLPKGEAKGVYATRDGEWQLTQAVSLWPIGPGYIGTIDPISGGRRAAVGITDQEFERLRARLERGDQPQVAVPPRRVLTDEEATVLRMQAIRARAERGMLG